MKKTNTDVGIGTMAQARLTQLSQHLQPPTFGYNTRLWRLLAAPVPSGA